jgi:DNA-binding NtrC family response regulator
MAVEIFGCEPGALPGIVRRRMGWLEMARDSTLVLDEFGQLDRVSRQRLEAALKSGGFTRHGGTETLPLGTRLLGITHPRPGQDQGWFAPLPPRLLGEIRIELQPLRNRLDDLPAIIHQVLDRLALGLGRPAVDVDPSAFRLLLEHDWPGNFRELTEVLQRGLLAAGEGAVTAGHLAALQGAEPAQDTRSRFGSERDWILDGLRRNRFRRGEAARFLGVSRKTLYNRMVALGLAVGANGRGMDQTGG